tara:strand:+ start:14058 stop:19388 length:5331 start_codon:yes stop_codon:yes gene_type:complete
MAQSFNASLNVTLNTASLNASTKQVRQALGRITGQASEFQKSLDASTARVFAFGATTAVLNGVTQSFKKLISTTIEVEKRLIEVNSIFQATEASFNKFRNSIFQVAKETGQSFSTVADGAAELARQGLSAEETALRLKSALVLTRISGLDAEKSVKALTAAINGFESAGLKHTEIVNKMVAVDTAFAVSAQDLAEAFSRAGSTAEDAGVSFDELLGLVTAVEQKTARGGAVIGNAFKSIFTRLARGSTIDDLKELGVQIDSTQTGVQKLNSLSKAIEGISDPTVVSKIKELAGGVFQINVVSAALKDLTSETSIFREAAETAAFATNEAFEKNKALGESLAANINKLVIGLTSLAEKVGTVTFGPILENLVGIATKFTEFLDTALDPEKGNTFIKGFFKAIGTFLSGPAIVLFTVAFVKITKLIARFAGDGLKSLFQMGTQTERIKQIEGGIVGLLQRDSTLRKQMESTTMSQAQKEQAVIAAIKRENALLTTQAQLMRNLASAAAARGVKGFSDSKGFTGKAGKRYNAGFKAEEAEAMMLGASPSVKAHMGKGTIGGKKFIMNNQEKEVPKFAGGRDSAVLPRYPKGFVPNYLDVDTVGKRPRSAFFDADGNGKTDKVKNAIRDPSSALGAALIAKRDAAKGKKTYYANNNPNKAVMIIPEKMGFEPNKADHRFTTPYGKKKIDFFEGGMSGISPNLKGNKRFGNLLGIEDNIQDNLGDAVNASLNQLTSGTPLKTNPRSFKGKEVTKLLEKGGAGAFGAIKGAIFEGVIQAITGGVAQDKGQLDIQFDKARKDLELIFGLDGGDFEFGDFKSSSSEGNKTKYAKQIIDNVSGRVEKGKKTKVKNEKRRARGFIPNFTKKGGVPISMMRVHKDDQGEPVAVTNLRDEPNGLQDAVKRERNGVGMFADGFVPNYSKGAGIASLFGMLKKGLPILGQKAKSSAKGLGSMENKMGKATTGFFLLSSVSGMVTASMEQRHAALQAQLDMETENVLVKAQLLDKDKEGLKHKDTEVGSIQNSVTARAKEILEMQRNTESLISQRSVIEKSASVLDKFAGVAATFAILGTFGGRGGKGQVGMTKRQTKYRDMRKAGVSAPAARGKVTGPAAKFGKFATSAKGLGVLGTLLTVGGAGFQVNSNSKRQDIGEEEKSRNKGKIIGGASGAIAGATIGAAIGSIVPVFGTAIGLVAGALIGAAGSFIGAKAGEIVQGGEMTDEQKAADLNPVEKARVKADGVLPEILEEEGFGTGKKGFEAFDKRIFEMDNATPEFVKSIVDSQRQLEQFALEISRAESRLEAGKDGAAQEVAIAESKYASAREKLSLEVQKGAKLQGRQLPEAIRREKIIDKANIQLANAQEKLAAAQLKLARSSEEMLNAANKNLENAQLGSMMAQITPTGKGTGDEFGFNQQTNVLRSSQQETTAGIDLDRANRSAAENAAANAGSGVLANSKFASQRVQDMAAKIRSGGENGTITATGDKGEEQKELVADAKAFNAAVGDTGLALDNASKNFELNVKKAYIGFQKSINEIEALQRKNAEARAALLQSSIQAASDQIATVFGGEGLDMDFMGQQVSEIVNEINKGEGMDKDALGAMIAEFDDQGLGVKIGDLIQQFDPNITGEKLARVLQDTLKSGIGSGAQTPEGKKIVGAMGNAVKGGTDGFFKDSGVDISDGMKRIDEESKILTDRLEIVNGNIAGLFAKEDTENLALEMGNLYDQMVAATSGLSNFSEIVEAQSSDTEKVASLIKENTEVLVSAKKALDESKNMIADSISKIEEARGK